jgi:hypothetical protein
MLWWTGFSLSGFSRTAFLSFLSASVTIFRSALDSVGVFFPQDDVSAASFHVFQSSLQQP